MSFDHQQFVQGLTTRPGVYQMMDADSQVRLKIFVNALVAILKSRHHLKRVPW